MTTNPPAAGADPPMDADLTLFQKLQRNPVYGFAPWIIYWVVANSPSTWLYGALAAAIAAIVLAIPDARARKLKILDVATAIFFVVLFLIGLFVGAEDRDWMDTYSNPLSSGALALIALGSLAFVPFTEQYARESTPEEYWNEPTFKHINRVLTLMWGLVFAAIAICGLLAVKVPETDDWTNWVIPVALLVGAFKFTAWYPDKVTGGLPEQQ
ncbi:hypothetical protein [Aldersonia kunmingensis]|uniref:hypothetical protein n=1 Tax=Aldersonia kunmingensis TaxID=408066 RepID=UPI000AD54C29|nr:hypothetical protein [Aldersonia kunmingensis]